MANRISISRNKESVKDLMMDTAEDDTVDQEYLVLSKREKDCLTEEYWFEQQMAQECHTAVRFASTTPIAMSRPSCLTKLHSQPLLSSAAVVSYNKSCSTVYYYR